MDNYNLKMIILWNFFQSHFLHHSIQITHCHLLYPARKAATDYFF